MCSAVEPEQWVCLAWRLVSGHSVMCLFKASGMVVATVLGQLGFVVQHVDGDVVGRVLMCGVIADGSTDGWVALDSEFQHVDHLRDNSIRICLDLEMKSHICRWPTVFVMSISLYGWRATVAMSLSINFGL